MFGLVEQVAPAPSAEVPEVDLFVMLSHCRPMALMVPKSHQAPLDVLRVRLLCEACAMLVHVRMVI